MYTLYIGIYDHDNFDLLILIYMYFILEDAYHNYFPFNEPFINNYLQ